MLYVRNTTSLPFRSGVFMSADKGFNLGGNRYSITVTDSMKRRAGWLIGGTPTWGEMANAPMEQLNLLSEHSDPANFIKRIPEELIAQKVSNSFARPYTYHHKAKEFISAILDGKVLSQKTEEFRYKLCADILCWHNLGRMPEKAATLLFDLKEIHKDKLIDTINKHYFGKIDEFIDLIETL